MRTLKKSLCLVLALVFVLGLCTVGANATYAQYSDMDTVTYADPVEVLSGLGVIDGYPDGTFNPTAEVTRAEAAAMIARMMLGRESADKLPIGDVKFSDVPETNWAAKYISWCANKGIIVGMGDGTFSPSTPVTGTQLACMLLRALGYGVIGEYEGKGWDINAVADALYYGVFADSLVTDFTQPASREETALYIWNTLWIQLVGYDVDLNYYDGKFHIDEDEDWFVPVTFARENFNLDEISYKKDTTWDGYYPAYMVVANQATGSKFTIIGRFYEYEEDGFIYCAIGDLQYLDYETPLEMIGHEVAAYVDETPAYDKAEHQDYYKTYLVKDLSTVLDTGKKLDDFYRAAKEANKDNVNVDFLDIPVITSYNYQRVSWHANLRDADDGFVYTYIGAVKGQKSSKDGAPRDIWILDHEGMVLCTLASDYAIAKVLAVDADHDEIELDVWLDDDFFYRDDVYPMTYGEESLVYEGIAKDDYVVVTNVGELYYITETTTVVADITESTFAYGGYYFNYYTYGPDWAGLGIKIPNKDDPADVGLGDKVLFYMSPYGYFGLEIVEKAKTEGIVLVVHIGEYLEHDEWDTVDPAKYTTVYKVQCINQDGEEVVYMFSKKDLEKDANLKKMYDQITAGSLYEVTKQGKNYYFSDNTPTMLKNVSFIKNDGKKTSFLKDGDNTYFVTSDTKVIYYTGKEDTLEITVSSALQKAEYDVYAVSKVSGGTYKLNTVWVLDDTVKAPEDFSNDSLIFVNASANGHRTYNQTYDGYELFNGEAAYYHTVLIDGVPAKIHATEKVEAFADTATNMLNYGFYQFNIDEDGYYVLNPIEKDLHDVKLTKGCVKDGKLYLDGDAVCDGVELKVVILDLSGSTVDKTKKDAVLITVERLEELLDEDYIVYADYAYAEDTDGNKVPIGTMYITRFYYPDGSERGTTEPAV